MEMPTATSIKRAVMAGMGLGFCRRTRWAGAKSGAIEIVPVDGTPVVRLWNVVPALACSPAAEAFRYFILEEGEAFLGRARPPW